MYTYQDLLKVGENEQERAKFCKAAVEQFMASDDYKLAKAGEAYYAKHNLTIEKYEKFLYTLSGARIKDIWSANFKLKTQHFRRLIIQQVQYVLGNGLTLSKPENKKKLGKTFDNRLQKAAKHALAAGRAFGFWNLDHMEVFGYADTAQEPGFCPLYDENTAELSAGIRFWFKHVGDITIFRATLYEIDGYTEYSIKNTDEPEVLDPKRSYKQTVISTNMGIEETINENYGVLPIVVMYGNDLKKSELDGMREDIDCYDFIKSGLANNIDDADGFYWLVQNSGGMDDADLAAFIERMKTVHAAAVEGDGATAHTIQIPTEARKTMLEILNQDIYDDFQMTDIKNLSAAQKTTQEIDAAYQSQDNKCADFEYLMLEFVQSILNLAGIDDTPSFVWNKVVNQTEYTAMVLSASNYLTDEMVIKKLPFLTPEEQAEVIKQRDLESKNMYNQKPGEDDPEDEEDENPEEDEE